MAVALDTNSSIQSGAGIQFNGVTSVSSTAILTPTAALTAMAGSIVFSGPAVTNPAMTWNGTNMPIPTGADTGNITNGGNNDRAIMFGVCTTSVGTHTLAASWTTATAGYFNGAAFKGTGSTTSTTFINGTTHTGTGTAASVTVNSPTGDMAIGVCEFAVAAATGLSGTTWWNDDTGANDNGLGNFTAGAGASTSLSATVGSSNWGYAACDIAAAAAGVTDVPGSFTGRTYPVQWNINKNLLRNPAQDTSSFGVETNPHWIGKTQSIPWNVNKALFRNSATDVPVITVDTPIYFIPRTYPVQWNINKQLFRITAQDTSSFGVETNPHWIGKPWPVAWKPWTLLQNSAADVPATAVETNSHWIGKTYAVQWNIMRALWQNTPTDVSVSAVETNVQFVPRTWPVRWNLQASLLRGTPQDFSTLPPASQAVYARYGASHGIGALSAIPGEIPS